MDTDHAPAPEAGAPPAGRSAPYRPVLTHPVLRRVLPGLAVSALGDGMSAVAVSWLALQLAPEGQRGMWVALAVAAYTMPAVAGTVVFRRLMRGRSGAQLAGWNALLRCAGLGAIPVAYALGGLSIALYVALLAFSSLLAAWGSAGRYTLVTEVLPRRHHLAANAVMTTIAEFAAITGPPLAGLLIGQAGAVAVIALDAASFAVLAATYRFAVPRRAPGAPPAQPNAVASPDGRPGAAGGGDLRAIARSRGVPGLLLLTFGFFALFGPVYVILPVHLADDLSAPATMLGAYYTAFGTGAVLGGLLTGYLRRWPLWPTAIGIVAAFGAAMVPFGLGAPTGVTLAAFAVAGFVWAPFMSVSVALLQRGTPPALLPQVLAFHGTLGLLAVPLGTVLGGPLVTVLGPRTALLACALATVALGAGTALGRLLSGRSAVPSPAGRSPAGRAPAGTPDDGGTVAGPTDNRRLADRNVS